MDKVVQTDCEYNNFLKFSKMEANSHDLAFVTSPS